MNKLVAKIKPLLIPFFVFLLAFSIRFIYLNQIKTNPFFIPYEGGLDDYLYDTWAREIAFKDFFGKEIFYGLPLYPYFLAFVYFLFGHDLYIARLVQFFIGALNCALIYFIGKRIFNKYVGLVASVMLALYIPCVFYEGFLSSSFLSIFLNSVIILLILQSIKKPGWKKWLLIGILIGISGLSSASIFLFTPFLILWLFTTFRKTKYTKRSLYAISLCAGICFVVGLVTLRNYTIGKDFVPISWHTGITFYAGNNPNSDGTFFLPPSIGLGVEQIKKNSKMQAEHALKKRLKPSEISSYWFQQGINFIKKNPREYLKLLIDKFILFWNAYEISDVLNINLFIKKFSPILQTPLFNLAVVLPFSILGIVLTAKLYRQPPILLLYLLILSHMLSVILYFVNSRYRLPIVPFLIIYASCSIVWIFSKFKNKDFSKIFLCLPLLIVVILIENVKLVQTGPEAFYNNLGVAYKRKNMYEQAEREYKKAIELKPDYITPYYNLGILYSEQGLPKKAIEQFEKSLILNPELYKAHNKAAQSYISLGQKEKALYHWKKSLQINFEQPEIKELMNSYK